MNQNNIKIHHYIYCLRDESGSSDREIERDDGKGGNEEACKVDKQGKGFEIATDKARVGLHVGVVVAAA